MKQQANTEQLMAYKQMPIWTADTIPDSLTRRHNTQIGSWAKLTILEGELECCLLDENDRLLERLVFDKHSKTPYLEPQVWHKIQALTDDLRFYLTFYCQKEDYAAKKYGLSPTHSEVLLAEPYLKPKSKVLDLGSGQGRNSLYLSLSGHDLTALDANQESLARLEEIAKTEQLDLDVAWYDINQANLKGEYDFILSTVVFMFLDPDRIPVIIRNMQDHTAANGYNLIVCAMDTPDYPCPMPFPFTFKEGQLKHYYKDWELLKYNENLGQLHRLDAHGNRLKMRFATLLARKTK